MDFDQAHHNIKRVIEESSHDSDRFAERLRRERIPHLSFSQVTTIEFCPRRYYLQYIKLKDIVPEPIYFIKGKLLHQLLAEYYLSINNGGFSISSKWDRTLREQLDDDHYIHLLNAFSVHQENAWCGCNVVSVEHPFVMQIDTSLPPMVGVIDLILKRNGSYLLVDHKSGRNFYPDDELQVAIYAQYIRRAFGGETCQLFYDHYRWVNNLARIRKPAFQRVEVHTSDHRWPLYLKRIKDAYSAIKSIQNGENNEKYGECFRCPYKNFC